MGLADQVFTALSANDYGVFDGLVTAMIPAVGDTGTAHLKNRLAQALADRPRKAGGRDLHRSVVRSALQEIADAQADVDAYIALVPVQDRSRPQMGAEIGRTYSTISTWASLIGGSVLPHCRRKSAITILKGQSLGLII